MANERIVPASKQSAGGIQPSDLVVGEIAVDESTGVLVQKRADGGLDVYGKRGVLSNTEVQSLINASLQNISDGDMLASNNLSEVDPTTARNNLDVRSTTQVSTEILNAVATISLSSLGGLTQTEIDARADARISAQFDSAPGAYNTLQKVYQELADDDTVQNQLLTDLSNKINLGATIGGRII